jgi:hypothetical protein
VLGQTLDTRPTNLDSNPVAMRTILSTMIAFLFLSLSSGAQEIIRPLVAPAFGKPAVVEAEFVMKPDTYYAQNIIKEPYQLKAYAVNSKLLKSPVLIEYTVWRGQAEGFVKTGNRFTLEAYETLYQPSFSTPWLQEGEQGMAFSLMHRLVIRLPVAKQAREEPGRKKN